MRFRLLKAFLETILALIWILAIVSIYESFKEGLWAIIYFSLFFYIIFFIFNYIIEFTFLKKIRDLIYSTKILVISTLILISLIIISLLYKEDISIFIASIITNIFSFLFALNVVKIVLRNKL